MAMRGLQLTVGDTMAVAQEGLGHGAGLRGREEPIAADRHDQDTTGDGGEGLLETAVVLAQVELVHGAGHMQVGVGVEALYELLSLVLEVAFDLEIGLELVRHQRLDAGLVLAAAVAPELPAKHLLRDVGDVAELAGLGESNIGGAAGVVVVAVVPGGVGGDGVAGQRIEGQRLGGERGGRGDGHGMRDGVGVANHPVHHLHATEGGTDQPGQAGDAKVVAKTAVGIDNVADSDGGKGRGVGLGGRGIDGSGPSRPFAAPQDVGADDVVVTSIDALARTDHAVPPPRRAIGGEPGGMGIAGEGVADEDDVVAFGIELAVGFVGDLQFSQGATAREGHTFRGQDNRRHLRVDAPHATALCVVLSHLSSPRRSSPDIPPVLPTRE